MTKHRITAANVVFVLSLAAGTGLFVPGSPAYLPSLLVHYSHSYAGHSLGYWVQAVDGPDAEARRQALVALGAIGPDAAEAVPALARILTEDADDDARNQAALALAKILPASSAAALPALARALDEDESPHVRMNALIALSRLGKKARPAVPILIKALRSRANRTTLGTYTLTIQEMAALTLGWATAGTSEGVAALMEALQTARTANKRRILAQALGEIGAPARAAAPLLRPLLAEKDAPELQQTAAESLRKILGDQ